MSASSSPHQCGAGRLGHAVGCGEAVPREVRPEGDERVRIVACLATARCPARVAARDGDRCRMRSGQRHDQRLGDVDVRAAHRTWPARRQWPVHTAFSPPRAALNSVIISSHTGRKRRRPRQNSCDAAGLEQLERRALLLDPGVVAEVEDAVAVALGALDGVGGRHVGEVLAPHLRRVEVGEPAAEVAGGDLGALARVQRRAVGGHGDDRVVGAEVEQLGGPDRGQHVADATSPKCCSVCEHRLRHQPAVGEVAETVVGVEHHVQLVGGPVADRDDDVGVHHVVDQRDVLVADALDVVLAEAVLQHRRALQRLDGDDLRAVRRPSAGRRRRWCRPSRWRW